MTAPSPPSPRKRNWLRWFFLQLEKIYDTVHRFLAWITGRLGKPMTAEIYFASPIRSGIEVKGRVLLAREWHEPTPDDSRWQNFVQMMRRWMTPERPRSLIRVFAGETSTELRADEEGYFETVIAPVESPSESIRIEFPESTVSPPLEHEVCEVGADYHRLIVSDIDDTVLVTHAARTLRMIATTLFGNAFTRQLFPGVSELYHALRDGPHLDSPSGNPILYVTSSPYNLHSLLKLIFERNRLPLGPFFMTDWGLDADKWFKKSHREHKVEAIEEALHWYPEVPTLLIGDSGQHDTMIYVELAQTYPDRIRQILIRDVTGIERREYLQGYLDQLEGTATEISFFGDSAEAAKILTQSDWISREQEKRVTAALNAGTPFLCNAESH